jgi:hypothetical protein
MAALIPTQHAWERWQARAPRVVRSRRSFATALRTARPTGLTHHGCAVYRALAMALIVSDGVVLTCWRWRGTRPAPESPSR